MFRKMQESKDYPCENCGKKSQECRGCKAWQDCFRYEWQLMRDDFNKWKRGEKIV